MNVLVCGGAGYIGSNMTELLTRAGHKPIVYDNLSKGHASAVKNVNFIKGDLADYDLLVKTLKTEKIDAVMHFAAFIEVGESVDNPLKYYHNNTANTLNLLTAMNDTGVQKFVFSSTAAVYGIPEKTPIAEDFQTKPINPYGQSKLAVEQICRYQSLTGKLNYVTLRYFNACGAGFDCTLGEDHQPESHLIPLAIAAALGQQKDVKIFGTDYPTPDGTCIRDYIHVEDLCSAHLLALDKLDTEPELIYNLGNGNGFSVREVIEMVKKVSSKDFKVTEAERRPGDPEILTADQTLAKKQLNWQAKFTNLEKIIETAWTWHNKFPNGYKE